MWTMKMDTLARIAILLGPSSSTADTSFWEIKLNSC